jgi:hypothetical protein
MSPIRKGGTLSLTLDAVTPLSMDIPGDTNRDNFCCGPEEGS